MISDLDSKAADLVAGGLAVNSRRAYSYAVTRFLDFCTRYALDPIRIEESTVIRFIAYLSCIPISPSTVRVYLAGIRAWIISEGHPPPYIYSQRVKWALRSLDRSAPNPVRARPFTMSMLRVVFHFIDYSYDNVLMFSAMLLGYFGCLRSSEYCYAPGCTPLLLSHVKIVEASTRFMIISVQSSKTAHKGFQLVVGCSRSAICAVCWLKHFISIRSHPPSLPLFTLKSGVPLTRAALSLFMRQSLSAAGMDPSNISTHSLRAGSATDAAGLGLTDSAIQQLGRWKSSAFTVYLRPSQSDQAAVAAQLASIQGRGNSPT